MKKVDVIICECSCDEHQIIFKYDNDPEWENVYISYHLQNRSFINRLKYAIKYIFGYKSIYGHWGELILRPDDDTIGKFENVVNVLKKQNNK